MMSRTKVVPYKSQKYKTLRAKHEQLGTLFSDPLFPPTTLSIYRGKPPPGNIVWKRPQELCINPSMFLENEQLNIVRGKLGKTWFVTACYALCNTSELWNRVIPNYREQVWNQKPAVSSEEAAAEIASDDAKRKYAGIFHFRFWRFGKWIDVVIDDQLPVLSVAPTAPPSPSASSEPDIIDPGLPLFTRSCNPNEMWVSLVEKAYAKLLGSYEDLEYGTLKDALVDFTGGVSEELSWAEERSEDCMHQIFRTMFSEVHEHSLVCCKVGELEDEESESTRTEVGLIRGRTYIVTSAKKVHLTSSNLKTIFKGREKVSMVCLKDPVEKVTEEIETVDEAEDADGERDVDEGEADSGVYVYPTSKLRRLFSKSPEWAKVSNSQLARLGLTCQSSNELWIPWDDLCPVLSLLTICRLFNTNVFALGRAWKEKSLVGSWTKGAKGTSADRSGGGTPHKYPQTFLRNPQYLFDVPVQEEELVIQLIQWPIEVMDVELSHVPLAIAINVLQVEVNRKFRMHTLLSCCPLLVGSGPSSTRELFHRGFFTRGRYLLIPTTEVPGDAANYFLRVFSLNSDVKLREVKREYPVSWRFQFLESCFGHQIFVSSVTVKDAQGLKRQMGSCNPYCVVICEGSKSKTEVKHNTRDPIWNTSFIFYRKKIDKPIVIRVYSHNFIMPDNFLGEASFPALVNHTKAEIQTDLVNPKIKDRIGSSRINSADSATANRGSITVEILTEDDPMAV